jgi:hypothetical protein
MKRMPLRPRARGAAFGRRIRPSNSAGRDARPARPRAGGSLRRRCGGDADVPAERPYRAIEERETVNGEPSFPASGAWPYERPGGVARGLSGARRGSGRVAYPVLPNPPRAQHPRTVLAASYARPFVLTSDARSTGVPIPRAALRPDLGPWLARDRTANKPSAR